MKKTILIALAGCAGLWAQVTPPATTSPAGAGSAQRPRNVAPSGPTKKLPSGEVDLSGVWQGGGPVGDLEQGLPKGEKAPLSPAGKDMMASRKSADDPEANCLPTGVPRLAPYPWRIIQTPTHVKSTHIFILQEGNIHTYRQIFMDGRQHPPKDELDPTWFGHSIGHWEGDTLVIDTVGYNDKFWFDFRGHPHTEQLHTVERYRRVNEGKLEIETMIEDPGAYTKPFTIKFTATLRPNEELMEYICQENNIDVKHIQGPAGTP